MRRSRVPLCEVSMVALFEQRAFLREVWRSSKLPPKLASTVSLRDCCRRTYDGHASSVSSVEIEYAARAKHFRVSASLTGPSMKFFIAFYADGKQRRESMLHFYLSGVSPAFRIPMFLVSTDHAATNPPPPLTETTLFHQENQPVNTFAC